MLDRSLAFGAVLVSGAILVAFIAPACSKDEASVEPAPATDAAAYVYRGQGCDYDVPMPERFAFQDVRPDDPESEGAAPLRVRLGLGGRVTMGEAGYADASRSAALTWQTKEPSGASRVRFGQSPDTLTETRAGFAWTTAPPESGLGSTEPETYMHEVHVCGLEPGRTYYYQVGGGAPEVWSATQSFTTVPQEGKVTVGIMGDSRDDVGVWQLIQMRLKEKAVNLQMTTGDLVYIGTQQSLYDKWLGAIWKDPNDATRFLTLGQQMMLMVAGNHELEAARFFGAFALPGEGEYAESYASLNVLNTHFVLLDDQPIAMPQEPEQKKTMLDWLEADLTRAEANRATVPFIVVLHHRGLFTTSNHATDSDVLDARKALVPIYDKHKVDLVLNGHDHAFEKTKPLVAGADPRGEPTVVGAGQGRLYVVNAGAGAGGYAVGAHPAAYSEKALAYGSGTPYSGLYSVATLEGRKFTLESYGLASSASATDTVIDTVELTR